MNERRYAGRTIAAIGRELGYGLYLHALFREGVQMPVLPEVKIEMGDVLRLSGPGWVIERVAQELGANPVRPSAATEVAFMAIAIVLGYALGLISVGTAGIHFSLGAAAGVMLAGIIVSTLRARNPQFGGPVNEGARNLMQSIGLSIYVAVLGINVGAKIVDAFQEQIVIWIAVIGLAATLLPAVLVWWYGRHVLKMNPAVLAGAIAGVRGNSSAMRGVKDESQSITPAIGFTAPYALSTVFTLIGGYLAMLLS